MIRQFRRTRRSAVAIMFALCLLPLVLLVGLAIDTAFYSQARTQVGLAAEAAATHAVRVASGAYTLDIANKDSQSTASSDGINQGEAAGTQWFSAQLGPLLRASTPAPSVVVNSYTTANGGNNGAGFTGTVTYTINYPPIFSALFGSKTSWSATATATAQSAFQFVEVLLLIDTSQSMLIGADPTTITSMSENSVCPANGTITQQLGLNPMLQNGNSNYYTDTRDTTPLTFSSTLVPHFTLTAGPTTSGTTVTGVNGTCASGYQPGLSGYATNEALAPCALACHTTTNIANGEFTDLYGIARKNNDQLRLDIVITATEKVIQDLYNAEQAANQFTVGVYQFSNDVSAMVTGTAGSSASAADEATPNLEGTSSSALSTIENSYDYNYAGNASLIPAVSVSTDVQDGNTDFPDSAQDLINGKATGGMALQKVVNTTANPAGSSSTNPQKNIFIVTDGFEDHGTSLYTRFMGEMTSYKNEEQASATATCQQFKNLGFNVYVLYVYYNPVPTVSFYNPADSSFYSTTDATDFSQFTAGNNVQENVLAGAPSGLSVAEVAGSNPDTGSGLGSGEVGPDVEALEACASPGDFYEASSSTDIGNAMEAMLRSAISSSITITQ